MKYFSTRGFLFISTIFALGIFSNFMTLPQIANELLDAKQSLYALLLEMSLRQALGVIAAAIYMVLFYLVQRFLVDGNGIYFSVSNLVASLLMLISLTENFHLGSAFTQTGWIVISIYGMAKRI